MFIPSDIFLFAVNRSLAAQTKAGFWFILGYVFPQFSFGVILLDLYVDDGAKMLGRNVYGAWAALLLATPAYMCLYYYLDTVIPNAYGIAKHPCYCCLRRKPKRQSDRVPDSERPAEEQSEAVKIKINGLSKHYGSFKAVQNL